MGNKDAGRDLAAMSYMDYARIMGTQIDNVNKFRNSGVEFTNTEVLKYFKMLRNYTLNRIRWTCAQIDEYELRLIEWNIFHFGRCAMLRPIVHIDKKFRYQVPDLKIYKCTLRDINQRNGRANKIRILQELNHNRLVLQDEYNEEDFVIFTDEFLNAMDCTPFAQIAWEYACKLHEQDLAFNANAHKQQMPMVFNDAGITPEDAKKGHNTYNRLNFSVAEIMRSAHGRNVKYVSIPEHYVGKDGFMHEPKNVDNRMLDYLEATKKIWQSFMEIIGLHTIREKTGVYTVKRLQEDGDQSPDYITDTMQAPRILCAKEAALKFNIDIMLEVI